jgi:uncharacterized protein (DUF4415 family)
MIEDGMQLNSSRPMGRSRRSLRNLLSLAPSQAGRPAPRKRAGGAPVNKAEFRKAWNKASRIGRPPSDNPKKAVTLRLDSDVVAHFRATGPGWQTRIDAALRKAARLPKGAKRAQLPVSSFPDTTLTRRSKAKSR